MLNSGDYIGKYKIIARYPAGEDVYLVEHPSTGSSVMMTLWHHVHLDSLEKYVAFTQEAQALVSLRHSHIVPVLDFGVEDNRAPYVVTECAPCACSTLREYKHQSIQDALSIIKQVGLALHYAHQQGIVHRQLMPENIVFNAEGEALLAGFGLETILQASDPTLFDQIKLYPYTAPEQRQDASNGSMLSDQYALGCIAYELLTGQQPLQPLSSPGQLHPELPGHLEEAVLKAMATPPHNRYASIEAFIAALTSQADEAINSAPLEVMLVVRGGSNLISAPVSPFYDRPDDAVVSATTWPMPLITPAAVRAAQHAGKILRVDPTALLKKGFSNKDRKIGIVVAALVALLIVGGVLSFSPLLAFLPSSTATVVITPVTKHVTSSYTIGLAMGLPDAQKHQVGARALLATSPTLSKTIPTTGRRHQEAAAATGVLTFSGSGQDLLLAAGEVVPDSHGLQFIVDSTFSIPAGGSANVFARAVKVGASGNIAANDINGTYQVISDSSHQIITTIHIQNTSAFTSGQDAGEYTLVQQNDIDSAVKPLVNQLIPGARLAIERQLHPYEQFVNAASCSRKVGTDHQAGNIATDVTVSVSVTCKAQVYNPVEMRSLAASLFKSEVAGQLGSRYALSGDVVTSKPIPLPVQMSNSASIIPFRVTTDGIWAFQFDATRQQALAHTIAGKPRQDTVALLLKQEGVRDVSIDTYGWFGRALPASAENIKFVLAKIPVLQVQGQ